MKRLFICLGTLCFIIVLSVYSLYVIKKGHDRLDYLVGEIKQSYSDDSQDTVKKIAEFEKFWSKQYIVLSYIPNTTKIDGISASVARLSNLYECDSEEFLSECDSISYSSYLIYSSEFPHLYSIV